MEDNQQTNTARKWRRPGEMYCWMATRLDGLARDPLTAFKTAQRDDRGLETAENIIWIAVIAGIIGGIALVLTGILNDAVERIETMLGDAMGG